MMVVLAGFAAFAIDGGNLYNRHTRLQDIADACALAAGHQLGEEKGSIAQKKDAAFNKAVNYVNKNGLTSEPSGSTYSEKIFYKGEPGTMNVAFDDGTNEVKVDIIVNSNLYFARVLGFNQTPVTVSATARLGMAEEHTGNLVPLCFFWKDYVIGETYNLDLQPGEGESGNYGYLDYEPPSMFNDYIKDGYDGTLHVGQQVFTYTGASIGLVGSAIEDRLARCSGFCNPTSMEENCSRSVIIPIVNDLLVDSTNGKTHVTIAGFARFFITNWDKSSKTLTGVFIEEVEESEIKGNVGPEYLVQSVRLIK
jgi:hypothetical protein